MFSTNVSYYNNTEKLTKSREKREKKVKVTFLKKTEKKTNRLCKLKKKKKIERWQSSLTGKS